MSDIFISYTSSDRPKAQEIAERLEEQGWSVWWDRKIPPGESFSHVLEEALSSARCVVVLWSRASVESDWVQTEAAEGKGRGALVPAIIEPTELPLEFKRIQAADLSHWDGSTTDREFAQFLEAIRSVVERPASDKETQDPQHIQSAARHSIPSHPPGKTSLESTWAGMAQVVLVTTIFGAILVGGFKALFPNTPVREALTVIAVVSLVVATGVVRAWRRWGKRG